MVCGAKWKTCECPWFNCEELEEEEEDEEEEAEELDHTRMVRGPSSGGRKERASRGSRARSHRNRPPTYAEERSRRRRQEKDDEKLARKLQYGHDDEDDDDDYTVHYGEIVAVGNSAGHHMNESYRRPQQSHITPPMVPQPPPVPFERAATADYVAGVNKARGLRADAMEARLAERFSESRQSRHPGRRAFTHPIPPMPSMHPMHSMHSMHSMQAPPMSPMSVGPLPPGPMHPIPMIRRHTMEGDDYSTQSLRLTERMKPRHARYNQSFDTGAYSTTGRLQHDNQSGSKLAGLTGIGRGAHRVDEWREFVAPVPPPETVG